MPVEIPIVVDWESKPIERRPKYPPEPVGVSIKYPGMKSHYFAFAHPAGNNCSWDDVVRRIQGIWRGRDKVLFHGGKFDQCISEEFCGVPALDPERVEDTLYQLFLFDPDADTFSLKPSLERVINRPPVERDILKEWILRNVPGVTEKGKGLKAWGAWICVAPVELVGPYACQDTDGALELWNYLTPIIQEYGMQEAYRRELKVLRYLMDSERDGLRVNMDLLSQDVPTYQQSLQISEDWLRERLGRPDLDFNQKQALGKAMLAADGVLNVAELPKTKKGKPSVSKKNLTIDSYADPAFFSVLGYRNRLVTCLGTFMEKWLELADAKNCIYTNWHQTRDYHGGGEKGACTGRVTSSDPPFTNMAKSWDGRNDGYEHPDWLGLPPLPLVRQYILPDEGCWWVHRDWNQQEMRLMANYENGRLMKAYQERPWRVMNDKGRVKCRIDAHQFVTDMLNEYTRMEWTRKTGKILDLGMVYGEGKGKIAAQLGVSKQIAELIFNGHKHALPDLARLQHTIRVLSNGGQPVTTWGGRLYYCQEPRIIEMTDEATGRKYKKRQTYEYKQLNRLIQPGAADQAKVALIRYHEHPKRQGRFLTAVYDEINVSAEDPVAEDKVLRECMESIECDVPMLTDGKRGGDWANLEEVNDEVG
jgi:DNA polymerase I-like protein with 3'-5' exonuclease and polymerase domains